MTRSLLERDGRILELRMRRVEPEITTAEAQSMGISQRISSFTTRFDRTNRPRVNNIHLIARAVDGVLLAPGETFSLNERVGRRTAERGYQAAPAIINGRLVPSLGGGICQLATTMFNTIFESGLPITERRSHSFYIASYPRGRDAAMAWGGPDLKFKNDTTNWLLIDTSYTSSSVTVAIFGTNPGYTVTGETSAWTDVRPFTVREVPDSLLPMSSRRIEQSGANGGTVVVTREVHAGGELIRRDTFRSTYRPKEQIVRVGTRPMPSLESTVATPGP